MSEVTIEGHTIELSSLDKPFFPGEGLTKGDLVDYYRRVAEVMLPHLEGRPLTLHRFPEGIEGEGFFQQNTPAYFPEWIDRVTVEKEGGETVHVVCNEAATLVYLANQNCVTPHAWLSRTGHLRRPDRLVFDLDPPDDRFELVRRAARSIRELLEALGLVPFLMTTGSRGLHVVAPLVPEADFDAVRAFAHAAAELLAARHPDALTVEQRKDKREGRLFLDYLRNAYGQTAVPPYAVRAKAGAPVATPLSWDELEGPALTARRYTIQNLFHRLGQKSDPWVRIDERAATLEEPQRRLNELREEEGLAA